jgi:hypothetical protein
VRQRKCTCDNTGRGVEYQIGWCYGCWLFHNRPEFFGLPALENPLPLPFKSGSAGPAIPKLVRKVKCVSLGVRIETRMGCNGMRCRWSCEKGLPAQPAGYCQDCTRYEGDFNEDGETGPDWLS